MGTAEAVHIFCFLFCYDLKKLSRVLREYHTGTSIFIVVYEDSLKISRTLTLWERENVERRKIEDERYEELRCVTIAIKTLIL